MVELQFHKINKNDALSVAVTGDKLVFSVPKPTIIQPAEIIKVPTGIIMKVPKGHIVTLSTHPALSSKAAELFPGVIIVDSGALEAELEVAVRNSGRNQLNLLSGSFLAIGHISEIHNIEIGDFDLERIKQPTRDKTKPQKKNPFSFEVK